MLFSDWLKLLARNRFAISPTRMPMALAITGFAAFNSTMRMLQERSYGKLADQREIRPPIFIIGHWRAGTTLLHELMVLDERFSSPTTYQCFAPNHFIISEDFVSRWLGFVLPSKRPMDNMEAGWSRPQEDEFALCNLGLPSPYLSMAFPNRPAPFREYLDMRQIPPGELRRWKEGLIWFLRRVSLKNRRRVILKSPTHTGRIQALLEAFPEARFIHIVRNPYALVPSTIRLWQSLNKYQGLQVSRDRDLDELVFGNYERMYRAFEAQRHLVDPARFFELRYEDLVADPVGKLRELYERLDLRRFERMPSLIEGYFEGAKDYRTNRHELSPQLRAQIAERWADYIRRYGYDDETASR
jgi:hypothetical protein